jgi:hypothetical protein
MLLYILMTVSQFAITIGKAKRKSTNFTAGLRFIFDDRNTGDDNDGNDDDNDDN